MGVGAIVWVKVLDAVTVPPAVEPKGLNAGAPRLNELPWRKTVGLGSFSTSPPSPTALYSPLVPLSGIPN